MINRVVLVGRLTRDPELKYTTNGTANLRFTMAVNRTFKKDGQPQADFIQCVAWRGQAENMAKFLRKGSLIGVEGRIESGSYQSQDGSTRYTTDVITDNVQFLEPRNSQQAPGMDSNGEYPQYPPNVQQPQNSRNQPFGGQNAMPDYTDPFKTATAQANQGGININDDDLPF